jgi:hypothetical protein
LKLLKEFDKMAQKESIQRWGQQPNLNLTQTFSFERAVPANRHRIRMLSAIILLCWATTCSAGGPGIGFKVGAQTLDSPSDLEKTTRARFEVEISSPRFGNDLFDLALTFGGSSLGSYHDDYAGYDDDVLIEEFYSDHYSLFDIRLAGRLYPLGDNSRIKPYVGAGIGYFWFLDSWEYEYYETYEDPFFPGVFYTYSEAVDGNDTLANGLFPFVTAGLMVPIASNFELQLEVQYHYDKEDSGFDFGGPVYMFGCHFRF